MLYGYEKIQRQEYQGFPILYTWMVNKQTGKMERWSPFADNSSEIDSFGNLLLALQAVNIQNEINSEYEFCIGDNIDKLTIGLNGKIQLDEVAFRLFPFDLRLFKIIFELL